MKTLTIFSILFLLLAQGANAQDFQAGKTYSTGSSETSTLNIAPGITAKLSSKTTVTATELSEEGKPTLSLSSGTITSTATNNAAGLKIVTPLQTVETDNSSSVVASYDSAKNVGVIVVKNGEAQVNGQTAKAGQIVITNNEKTAIYDNINEVPEEYKDLIEPGPPAAIPPSEPIVSGF